MPADALAPYVAKTSTAMLLTEIVMVLIFHEGRFQMIAFSGDDIILKHIKTQEDEWTCITSQDDVHQHIEPRLIRAVSRLIQVVNSVPSVVVA